MNICLPGLDAVVYLSVIDGNGDNVYSQELLSSDGPLETV